MLLRLSVVSPKPRQSQHATVPIISYYFPLSLLMGPPRSHRRGPKAVLPCMFDSIVVRRGCRWGNFGDGY